MRNTHLALVRVAPPAGDAYGVHVQDPAVEAEEIQQQHAQAGLALAAILTGRVQHQESSHHDQQRV